MLIFLSGSLGVSTYYWGSRLGGRMEAPGVEEEPATGDSTTATTRSKPGEAGEEVLVDKTESDSDGARWEETHLIT